MPAGIVSDWKCVAKSGPTIDGRFIKRDWLKEMAESYDPAVYTAKLWSDHYRWQSYGSVTELKIEEFGEELKLFAKITPTRSLVELNTVYEQKLHFSIEPQENFAATGKTYLTGLGITDSPASLGTDEMRFSEKPGRNFAAHYAGEPAPDFGNDSPEFGLFQKMLRFFSDNPSQQQTTTTTTQEDDTMDEKRFSALETEVAGLKKTVGNFTASIEKFNAKFPDSDGGNENETIQPDEKGAQEFQQLSTQFSDLSGKFDSLLTKLEQEVPGTQFNETTGGNETGSDLL